MSPAPRFSTADIAKGAQPREEERALDRAERVDRADPTHALPEDANVPLFATDAAADFQRRWDGIQASFVDDPRRAVEEADALVAETMQRLADSFTKERQRLEQQLDLDRKLPPVENREGVLVSSPDARTSEAREAVSAELRAAEANAVAESRPSEPRISTEDLRIALRHYRSFFKRLLSV